MKLILQVRIGILILLIFHQIKGFSQDMPVKFGKIDKSNLETTVCPIDSNAEAFFIFDYGNSYFVYDEGVSSSDHILDNNQGFQMYYKRHFCIKIIDNQAFSLSDISIPLYKSEKEEKLLNLKAVTYNLVDGNIVKTKLKNSDVFTDPVSENWVIKKFAMPEVREGSVIEVEYTVKSDYFFNLHSWQFQYRIPVLISEYQVYLPEYFNYNQTIWGYYPIKTKSESRVKEIILTIREKVDGLNNQNQTYSKRHSYTEIGLHYAAENIPGYRNEDFLFTPQNYLSKVRFELNFVKFPYSKAVYFSTTWEEINKNLLQHQHFGLELDKSRYLSDEFSFLQSDNADKYHQLQAAFQIIKSSFVWNGSKNIYTSSTLKEAFKNRGGNAADINLNLVSLLRNLGFNAHPVVLSTQKNGIVHPSMPSISSFNYVIGFVELKGDTFLLDATDPNSDLNLLPVRCLNGVGRVIDNQSGFWIDLKPKKVYSLTETYNITISDDLSASGDCKMELNGYAKYLFTQNIGKYSTENEFVKSIQQHYPEMVIQNFSVKGLDTIEGELEVIFKFNQKAFVEKIEDLFLIKPSLHPYISENPFIENDRIFPVEYSYPVQIQKVYNFFISEKFSINELPKQTFIRNSDGKLKYIFNISQMGNKITLTTVFIRNKNMFLPDEYSDLKRIFKMILDKQNEYLVLKASE
ncbi:MAG: DUF3857 domain-containing protein [Bacteroidales bacterium]|nr:DUF3857 domain-containing protein [Bacteroidales bacterium]